jgi:hypothetical protein
MYESFICACASNLKLISFGAIGVRSLLTMPASDAKMDLANRALCFAYRHPPPGQKKVPYKATWLISCFSC